MVEVLEELTAKDRPYMADLKTPSPKPAVYRNVTPYAKLQLAANKRFEAAAAQEARSSHVIDSACFFSSARKIVVPSPATDPVLSQQAKGKAKTPKVKSPKSASKKADKKPGSGKKNKNNKPKSKAAPKAAESEAAAKPKKAHSDTAYGTAKKAFAEKILV